MRIAGGMIGLEKTWEVLSDTSTRTSHKSFKLNNQHHSPGNLLLQYSLSWLRHHHHPPSQARIMEIIWTPPSLSFAVIHFFVMFPTSCLFSSTHNRIALHLSPQYLWHARLLWLLNWSPSHHAFPFQSISHTAASVHSLREQFVYAQKLLIVPYPWSKSKFFAVAFKIFHNLNNLSFFHLLPHPHISELHGANPYFLYIQ